MEIKKFCVVVICLFFSLRIFAYDGKKCVNNFFKSAPLGKGWGEGMLLTMTTMAPTSTSQFVSSTGSCSALALNEQAKIIYYVKNMDEIKKEISKGKGEHLTAFAYLSGCNLEGSKMLPVVLKSNFHKIYGPKDIEENYNLIDQTIKVTPSLNRNCKNSYFENS